MTLLYWPGIHIGSKLGLSPLGYRRPCGEFNQVLRRYVLKNMPDACHVSERNPPREFSQPQR